MRVLIADDHEFVRRGLKQFVLETPGVTEAGEAATGQETLRRLRHDGPWAVLILDIDMPDRGGLDILRHVRASYPDTRILMMSGFTGDEYAMQALRAGAYGFLPKSCEPQEFEQVLQAVLAGRKHVSAELADRLIEDLQDGKSRRLAHETLSDREFQIFCKVALGRPSSDIARELCISAKTVSTYRSSLLQKLALRTDADLICYAMKNGLVN